MENEKDPFAGIKFNKKLVTPTIIEALIGRESGGDPNAKGKQGETGLGQIKKIAWEDVQRFHPELGVYPYSQATDPTMNKLFTEVYLNDISEFYLPKDKRSIEHILAAYNIGPDRYKKKYKFDWQNSPAKDYVNTILKKIKK